MTTPTMIAGDARFGRAVVLFFLGLIVARGYDPTPMCLDDWPNYVKPNPLPGALALLVILSLLFGAALAAFGPRWRIERLRVR